MKDLNTHVKVANFCNNFDKSEDLVFLDDHDLLNNLRKEKFDMAITELFDFSGLGSFSAFLRNF